MSAVWKISPGPDAYFWPECREAGCITINWLNQTDLRRFKNRGKILAALQRVDDGNSGSASSIWRFVHDIEEGDVVVANRGLSEVVAIGIITSDYLPPKSPKNPRIAPNYHRQARLVNWLVTEGVRLGKRVFNQPTLQKLTDQQVSAIRKAYTKSHPALTKAIDDIFAERPPPPVNVADDEGDDEEPKYIPNKEDLRKAVTRQIKERRGQSKFRNELRKRYGDCCMVTGCPTPVVLEAAHIKPYRGQPDNHAENGLLLRADIHTLFDLNLIGIHPQSMQVVLHPKLRDEPHYQSHHNQRLILNGPHQPSVTALKDRWRQFQKQPQ